MSLSLGFSSLMTRLAFYREDPFLRGISSPAFKKQRRGQNDLALAVLSAFNPKCQHAGVEHFQLFHHASFILPCAEHLSEPKSVFIVKSVVREDCTLL